MFEIGKNAQDRRLATAGRADHRSERAAPRLKRDAAQRDDLFAPCVEDLGEIARVSDVAGKDTRKVMKVLGRDAFRLLLRVSDLAAAAIGLVAMVLAQTVGMLAGFLHMTLRRLAREPRRRRPRGTVA